MQFIEDKLRTVGIIFFTNRLMFFSDNGPNPRIERASLDGQDRVVIVYRGILRVVSLTEDTDNDKLYWADHDRQTLEGCDYDGSNRRVIRRMNEVPLSSLIYHEVIYTKVSVTTGRPVKLVLYLKQKL